MPCAPSCKNGIFRTVVEPLMARIALLLKNIVRYAINVDCKFARIRILVWIRDFPSLSRSCAKTTFRPTFKLNAFGKLDPFEISSGKFDETWSLVAMLTAKFQLTQPQWEGSSAVMDFWELVAKAVLKYYLQRTIVLFRIETR